MGSLQRWDICVFVFPFSFTFLELKVRYMILISYVRVKFFKLILVDLLAVLRLSEDPSSVI